MNKYAVAYVEAARLQEKHFPRSIMAMNALRAAEKFGRVNHETQRSQLDSVFGSAYADSSVLGSFLVEDDQPDVRVLGLCLMAAIINAGDMKRFE